MLQSADVLAEGMTENDEVYHPLTHSLHPWAIAILGVTLWEMLKVAKDFWSLRLERSRESDLWQANAVITCAVCRVVFYALWLTDTWHGGSLWFKLLYYLPTGLFVPVVSSLFFSDLQEVVRERNCALYPARSCACC